MMSQRNFPGSGSRVSQYQRQYEIEVSGKSGLGDACGSFASGPRSDHSNGELRACPLNRWNVVMPMPGFTSRSGISVGRITTSFVCALKLVVHIAKRSIRKEGPASLNKEALPGTGATEKRLFICHILRRPGLMNVCPTGK